MIKEIDEKYHSVIANMQKVFKEEYDKSLTDNTLKDIDKISDKGQLNNAKTKLNELLQTIQNEKDIICMEDEVKVIIRKQQHRQSHKVHHLYHQLHH